MSAPQKPKRRMALTALIATATVAGMTAMAYAAVPLYQAFCRATGYGGTTQTAARAPEHILNQRIEVRFDANHANDLPVEFSPSQHAQHMRIGETSVAFYHVRNISDQPVTAVATFNVTPHVAGQYFAKLECFCFQNRTLAPGEEAELPVVYFVDPEIVTDPDTKEIDSITLSYTYFRANTANAAGAQAELNTGAARRSAREG